MMKTLFLVGRRWFQRTYGNTYHTVEIFIDGERVFKSDRCYGYGEHYQQTAMEWIAKNAGGSGEGDISTKHIPAPLREYESLWRYAERNGIKFTYTCIDVPREKDL